MSKNVVRNILVLTLPSLLVSALICELIVFRLILPATQFPQWYFDTAHQMLRYDSAVGTTGLLTRGPLARQRTHFRVNNYGWNSEIDYVPNPPQPLIAIIGDSFIEGFSVDPENSISAHLRKMLDGRYEVYRFGISGAPLSHYLHIARYVREVFNPHILVVNAVHNDFDEMLASVTKNKNKGMLYVDVEGARVSEQLIEPYTPSPLSTFMKNSALMRYLYFNCELGALLHSFRYSTGSGIPPRIDKYSRIDIDRVRSQEGNIGPAVDYVVGKLAGEKASGTLILMMDGARTDIYNDTLARSEISWLNTLLGSKCDKYRVPFLDLTDIFHAEFKRTGTRFETELDGHWNEYGHAVVARALAQKIRETLPAGS